ncbi:CHAT domain-containing protein [Actinoplanes sp. NPDC051851]|uniref:CHAT domain-containing protein n=1 Tax=Actinoplanes sp. NPDC051851 TaxID=3154753 RepID=UPI00341237C7
MSDDLSGWSEEVRRRLTAIEQHYDRESLVRALELMHQIMAAIPPGGPISAHFRYMQSWSHQVRFEHDAGPDDLERAIDFGHEAVAWTPDGDPQKPMRQATLAVSLLTRHRRTGDRAALDEAIELYREACRTGTGHLLHGNWQVNLGVALRLRNEWATDRDAVDESITAARGALTTATSRPHSPDLPTADLSRARLNNDLAQALWNRFSFRGGDDDLAEAIDLLRTTVAGLPPGHPDRALYASNLTVMLGEQSEHTGAATDLDAAIAAGRAATRDGTPPAAALINLATVLRSRYHHRGELADLDESIGLSRRGIDALDDETHRSMARNNLGDMLRSRFLRTFDRADLDEAARLLTATVAATPDEHPRAGAYLANLGGVLQLRFEWFRDETDMREAIRATRAAVAVTPPEHPHHGRYRGNLSLQLQDRFEVHGERSDLDEAVECAEAAARFRPAGHPERAKHLHGLGMALLLRADEESACRVLREAAGVTTAPAATRLRSAALWANTAAAAQRWTEAMEAYTIAVELLAMLAWPGVSRSSREQLLNEMAGLGADGAACAIAAGQPRRAVELVERGRAVLWAQFLETRTDLVTLRDADPVLADRMHEVRTALDTAGGTEPDAAMRLAGEWEDLLARARALPGFERFAAAPEFAALTSALPAEGPVVIVNVSRWRCDALLVDSGEVRVVPLTGVTGDEVVHRVESYLDAVEGLAVPRDLVPGGPARRAPGAALDTVLAWLWDDVVAPVLDARGYAPVPGDGAWPRVWWCPTGPLALLPLHAAGHHGEPGRSTLDRVVSSYTATLRSLAEATRRPPVTGNGRLLFVGLADTPGQSPLPAVERERRVLRDVLPADRRTELTGPDATREAILTALTAHPWVHAACHGSQVPDAPASGGLLPHDWATAGRVGITDVARVDHPGGELAFLSACQTATVSALSVDEVITLAAGLHYAGWRHVVGTLWTVADTAAAEVTHLVYARMAADGVPDPARTAEALHHAQRDFRANHPADPGLWAPFTHTGP